MNHRRQTCKQKPQKKTQEEKNFTKKNIYIKDEGKECQREITSPLS